MENFWKSFLEELYSRESLIVLSSIVVSAILCVILPLITEAIIYLSKKGGRTMKNITLIFLVVIFLLGCAQKGPYMVSPSVYRSSERAISANNHANAERAISNQQNEQLSRKRAIARHEVAIKTISEAENDGGIEIINIDGMIGGFPVIFPNDSRRDKTIFITKAGGELSGQRWSFYIPKGGYREYKLEIGKYFIQWTDEYSNTLYPHKGPDIFPVTPNPHYFHDKTAKNYHGGYRLYGR